MKTIPAGITKERGMAGGKWGDIYVIRREPETVYEPYELAMFNAQWFSGSTYCHCCGRPYQPRNLLSQLGLRGVFG